MHEESRNHQLTQTIHRKPQIECGRKLFNLWPLTILGEFFRCHLFSRLFVQTKRFQPQPFLDPQEAQFQMAYFADACPLAHTAPSCRAQLCCRSTRLVTRSFRFRQVNLALQNSCCRTTSRIKLHKTPTLQNFVRSWPV